MLHSFEIENFKKFEKLVLNQFSRINILVGDNNSGKSTVLEAIELASSNDFYNSLLRSLRFKNFDWSRIDSRKVLPFKETFDVVKNVKEFLFNQTSNRRATFVIAGENIDKNTQVSISINDNITKQQIRQLSDLISSNEYQGGGMIRHAIDYAITTKVSKYEEYEASIMVQENGIMSANIPQQHKLYKTVYFQSRNSFEVENMYSSLVTNKKKKLLIENLRVFDINISNIELINGEFLVDIGKDVLLPINYLGAGIISIIYLIIYILNSQDSVLLVDELENGIYYKKFADLIKVIDKLSKELNVQLFITTHSNDFLQKSEEFSEFSLYRLNEKKFDDGIMFHSREDAIEILKHGDLR